MAVTTTVERIRDRAAGRDGRYFPGLSFSGAEGRAFTALQSPARDQLSNRRLQYEDRELRLALARDDLSPPESQELLEFEFEELLEFEFDELLEFEFDELLEFEFDELLEFEFEELLEFEFDELLEFEFEELLELEFDELLELEFDELLELEFDEPLELELDELLPANCCRFSFGACTTPGNAGPFACGARRMLLMPPVSASAVAAACTVPVSAVPVRAAIANANADLVWRVFMRPISLSVPRRLPRRIQVAPADADITQEQRIGLQKLEFYPTFNLGILAFLLWLRQSITPILRGFVDT
jgi:hypothetical protein